MLAIRTPTAVAPPFPYGCCPVAATAAMSPTANRSLAVVTSAPSAWSGDMYCGVPMTPPVRVSCVLSAARAIPKSMTYGPAAPSRRLAGFRSRCTTPAEVDGAHAALADPGGQPVAGCLAGVLGLKWGKCAADSGSHGCEACDSGPGRTVLACGKPPGPRSVEPGRRGAWAVPYSPS